MENFQKPFEEAECRERLSALLQKLSAEDMCRLRRELLGGQAQAIAADERHLSRHEMLAAETWLWDRFRKGRGPRERTPRFRIWLIFMLLRHAGLRLSETSEFVPEDMDTTEDLVYVRGRNARAVPVAPAVGRRLKQALAEPGLAEPGRKMLSMDAGYLRRCFAACGSACGLESGRLNARALRRSRAHELLAQGLSVPVVDRYLGRRGGADGGGIVQCDGPKADRLLREHVQLEHPIRTSARNVFPCRITDLRHDGLLVEVHMQTAGGLPLTAIITDQSCRRLMLARERLVIASVKAPWVVIDAGENHGGHEDGICGDGIHTAPAGCIVPDGIATFGTAPVHDRRNSYEGFVEQVRSDGRVAEVLVCLSDGSLICALQSADCPLPAAGQHVNVRFRAFAVILSLDTP